MDYKAAQQTASLLRSLTDSHAGTLDPSKLCELKQLLKTSDDLVTYAQSIIMDRLAANHSQSRKLAVEVCETLFSRSRCFRRHMTSQFSSFVELTVGHKQDKPLPGPPPAALALRERALEVIEKWHEQWGLHYPQVTVAYTYLKKQYKFPEISSRAAAAAAAEAARQQRHQQMLLQRYEVFVQDFPQQRQQLASLMHQMQECFDLLKQPVQQQQVWPEQEELEGSDAAAFQGGAGEGAAAAAAAVGDSAGDATGAAAGTAAAAVPSDAAADDEQEWEDVAPQQQQQQQPPAEPGSATAGAAADAPAAAGLAAVQQQQQQPGDAGGVLAAADDFDMDELVGEYQPPMAPHPDDAARRSTVLEQLSDLAKQAQLATSQQLLDWLRLLTQLHTQGQQQQQQRQRLLRDVVDLRAQLQAQLQEAEAWGVGPGPTHNGSAARQQQAQQPAEAEAHAAGASSSAAAASTTTAAVAAAGNSSDAAAAAAALGGLPCRSQQPLKLQQHTTSHPGLSSSTAAAGFGNSNQAGAQKSMHITFGSSLRKHLQQGQPQQQQQQQGQAQQHVQPSGGAAGSRSRTQGQQSAHQSQLAAADAHGQWRQRQTSQQQLATSMGLRPEQQQQQAPTAPFRDPYATLHDPTAAIAGAYIIPKEVVQQHEQARWRHLSGPGPDSLEGPDRPEGAPSQPEPSRLAAAAAAAKQAPAAGAVSNSNTARRDHVNDTSVSGSAQHEPGAAAAGPAAAADGASGQPLDPSLRQKLLASAPQLPLSGQDWLLAHYGVVQHGMELYNHWGAVDAGAGIPQDRLQQLVGYAASYYVPNKKAKVPKPAVGAAASGAAAAATETGRRGHADTQGTAGSSAGADGGGDSTFNAPVQLPAAPQQLGAAAAAAAGATAAAAAGATAAASGGQQRRRRSQREEASAHNRAVLAGALTDEGVAAALQQQLDAEAAAAVAGSQRKGRAKKPPETKADKVRKKLLGLKK